MLLHSPRVWQALAVSEILPTTSTPCHCNPCLGLAQPRTPYVLSLAVMESTFHGRVAWAPLPAPSLSGGQDAETGDPWGLQSTHFASAQPSVALVHPTGAQAVVPEQELTGEFPWGAGAGMAVAPF